VTRLLADEIAVPVVVNCGIQGFVFGEGADSVSLAVEEEVFVVAKAAVVFNLDAAFEEDVAELFTLVAVGAVKLETRFSTEPVHVVEGLSVSATRDLVEFLVLQNFVLQNFVCHFYQPPNCFLSLIRLISDFVTHFSKKFFSRQTKPATVLVT